MASERTIYETIYLLEDREPGGEWALADDAEPLTDLDQATELAAEWTRQADEPAGYEVCVATYHRLAAPPEDGR